MTTLRPYVQRGALGLVMGFVLANIGFGDYAQLHAMFTFADLRMFLSFAGAVMFAMGVFFLTGWKQRPSGRILHKGVIPGGILFGLGWVLSGACPSIALVQLGEGRVAALVSMAGIALGAWVYPKVHAHFFRWDRGGCELEP